MLWRCCWCCVVDDVCLISEKSESAMKTPSPETPCRSDRDQVTHSAEAPMYTKNIQQAQARYFPRYYKVTSCQFLLFSFSSSSTFPFLSQHPLIFFPLSFHQFHPFSSTQFSSSTRHGQHRAPGPVQVYFTTPSRAILSTNISPPVLAPG
jgi:hypothetical protein